MKTQINNLSGTRGIFGSLLEKGSRKDAKAQRPAGSSGFFAPSRLCVSQRRFFQHTGNALLAFWKKASVFIVIACLALPPGGAGLLAQQAGGSSSSNVGNPVGISGIAATSHAHNLPKATEFFSSTDARVVPFGGRISLKSLDLTRPPSEAELRKAGQLGSPLTPSRDAEPSKITNPAARKKQEDDNLLFGQAIQKWNEHKYPEAIELFKQHRKTMPDSPWAGEAELHLGCAA